jgi:hypothetical protein
MFGRSRKPPPNTPFQHGDRCKTPDATPEWFDSRDGRWQRTCSCGDEYREKSSDKITPNSPAARPAASAHVHSPECEGRGLDRVVTVEFVELDRAWRSHCMLCESTFWYWFQPGLTEVGADDELHPVHRRGNILYSYKLAREQVPA